MQLEPLGPSRTRYTAIVKHQSEADRAKHQEMGFEQGWGIALEQLVRHYKSMRK